MKLIGITNIFKYFTLTILIVQMTMGPYANAKKIPATMEKQFNQIMSDYKKNPTYANAAKAKQALWELNNKDAFVANNKDDLFSKKYNAFQLQMEEVTVATESLQSCVGGDAALQKKVLNIGDAFAEASSKRKLDVSNTQLLNQVNTTSMANFCLSPKPGQVMTPQQLRNHQDFTQALNQFAKNNAGKTAAQKEIEADRRRFGLPDLSNLTGKTMAQITQEGQLRKKAEAAAKLAAAQREVERQNTVVPTKGYFPEDIKKHIQEKFGFVMTPQQKEKSAKDLHLSLMAGNRENSIRNYVYYSQRFDFSGEDDLTQYSGTNLANEVARKADQAFQGRDWHNLNMLPDEEIDRLGKSGAREIEGYRNQGKSKRLSIEEVYQMLLPSLQEGGYSAEDVVVTSTIKRKINLNSLKSSDTPDAMAAIREKAQLDYKKSQFARTMASAEKGEVGFLLQSKDFSRYKTLGLSNVTKDQMMAMIKSSLKEKIQDTKDYSKEFIKKYQTTSNLWGDRGSQGLADIGKTLLYSSPTVIYDTISKNPKLMGSICLPLKMAAKDKDLALPDYVKFGGGMMSAVPVGGEVAGFAVGTTFGVALAAEYRNRKAGELDAQGKTAGVGNLHGRGQKEARDDKKDLARAAQAHRDHIGADALEIAKDNALSAVGGRIVSKVGGAVFKEATGSYKAYKSEKSTQKVLSQSAHDAEKIVVEDATSAASKTTGYTEVKLGEGAGGTVTLLSKPGETPVVRKLYKNAQEFSNDAIGLDYLSQLEKSGDFPKDFKIIQTAKTKFPSKELESYFEYHEGKTIHDLMLENPAEAPALLKKYEEFLLALDKSAAKNVNLKSKSEFPLFGSPAVHYQFNVTKKFDIVIQTKNILVTKRGLVLIDPH